MAYGDKSSSSSWDKLAKKQNKQAKAKQPKKPTGKREFSISSIPESYLGNEEFWDDLTDDCIEYS